MKDVLKDWLMLMGIMYVYVTIVHLVYAFAKSPVIYHYVTEDKKVISTPAFEGTNDASDS